MAERAIPGITVPTREERFFSSRESRLRWANRAKVAGGIAVGTAIGMVAGRENPTVYDVYAEAVPALLGCLSIFAGVVIEERAMKAIRLYLTNNEGLAQSRQTSGKK